MELTFWGVRAGIPMPGPEYARYGGNTVCIDVTDDAGNRAVIDAGTGLIGLGKSLLGGPVGKGQGEIYIFLSHTFWDHIQGVPYFVPAFIPGNKIHFWGRSVSDQPVRDLLEGQMKKEFNPICELGNMGSDIDVNEMRSERVQFGQFVMTTIATPHEGKLSLGYRIDHGEKAAVLLSDVHYDGGKVPDEVIEFSAGATILVHDGGSNGQDPHPCAELAKRAGVEQLVLTHYAPKQTDADIDALKESVSRAAGPELPTIAAHEGLKMRI